MLINNRYHETIRNINIAPIDTVVDYERWNNLFDNPIFINSNLQIIENTLGNEFNRLDIIELYRRVDIPAETKFIAAMIWGYSAPAGVRSDTRGPWKVSQMFGNGQPENGQAAIDAIRAVQINTEEEIITSYNNLNNNLRHCGPNFFTKHFYFLGKSQNNNIYPVIFDNRVAQGLFKLLPESNSLSQIIKVSTNTNADSYIKYLNLIRTESEIIGCEMDQLEYYLFLHARNNN